MHVARSSSTRPTPNLMLIAFNLLPKCVKRLSSVYNFELSGTRTPSRNNVLEQKNDQEDMSQPVPVLQESDSKMVSVIHMLPSWSLQDSVSFIFHLFLVCLMLNPNISSRTLDCVYQFLYLYPRLVPCGMCYV